MFEDMFKLKDYIVISSLVNRCFGVPVFGLSSKGHVVQTPTK